MSNAGPILRHVALETLEPEIAFRTLVDSAIDLPASDLFFVTNETWVGVNVRHHGIYRVLHRLSLDRGTRLIRYLKAEAGIDISEKRRPLDGRWLYRRDDGATVDLRINTIPTLYGEDASLRILDRSQSLFAIDQLGLVRSEFNDLIAILNSPGGLILVSGPTGAGKTTSLYAFLKHLNDGTRKINTIEDPIEYALEGLRQSQVNLKLHVGFPELLQSVLRQSPDIIMIGEIRDPITAETAVRAANSGQLVFATMHAPVAAGAIQSMLDLGVRPHFLSTSLLGAIGQRLVRRLCDNCKVAVDVSETAQSFEELAHWLKPGEGKFIYSAGACDECQQTGYVGRTGVFEVLRVTSELRQLIASSTPTRELDAAAIAHGMIEFRRSALLKVAHGTTSIEEVFRSVPTEFLDLPE